MNESLILPYECEKGNIWLSILKKYNETHETSVIEYLEDGILITDSTTLELKNGVYQIQACGGGGKGGDSWIYHDDGRTSHYGTSGGGGGASNTITKEIKLTQNILNIVIGQSTQATTISINGNNILTASAGTNGATLRPTENMGITYPNGGNIGGGKGGCCIFNKGGGKGSNGVNSKGKGGVATGYNYRHPYADASYSCGGGGGGSPFPYRPDKQYCNGTSYSTVASVIAAFGYGAGGAGACVYLPGPGSSYNRKYANGGAGAPGAVFIKHLN